MEIIKCVLFFKLIREVRIIFSKVLEILIGEMIEKPITLVV